MPSSALSTVNEHYTASILMALLNITVTSGVSICTMYLFILCSSLQHLNLIKNCLQCVQTRLCCSVCVQLQAAFCCEDGEVFLADCTSKYTGPDGQTQVRLPARDFRSPISWLTDSLRFPKLSMAGSYDPLNHRPHQGWIFKDEEYRGVLFYGFCNFLASRV